tara:strand:- start:511 stop:816 length:306 start_codon:yes stop_codon:yes gene_type:complete
MAYKVREFPYRFFEKFETLYPAPGTLVERGVAVEQFWYDDSESEKRNFQVWFQMNSDERESVGQAPLLQEEARELFNKLKESGWLTKSQSEAGPGKNASNW